MNDLPPWLQVLYPFSPRAHRSAEGRLNYVDEGQGPAVVMLHGNPTWSFFYRELILGLRDRNRCLALDHLGCGLSDKPQGDVYTLGGHIDRACDWLAATGVEAFHLVVHDWGGAIGMGLADRFRERVRSIHILNTAAFAFPSLPARIAACRIPLAGTLAVRGGNAFARAATRMTTVAPLSPAVRSGYLYPYGNWHDRVAIDRFVKDIPMRASHRSWPVLKEIEDSLPFWKGKPVQIIWGMQDWCFHERILKAWERILPDAEIHRLGEAGHYLLEDAGEAVLSRIRGYIRDLENQRP